MKPKPSYTPARLVAVSGTTAKEKLAKRWFVVYYIWSEARQEKVRKRIEVTGDTIKARQEEAEQIISEINALLESGAVIDPVETLAPVKPVSSEESEQVLSTHTLLKTAFVDHFLKIKKSELKEQSYTSYKKAARKFEMFLDKQKTPLRVRDFNEDLAHRFATFLKLHSSKDGGEIGNKSFNNYRGTVFTFCEFLISKRLLKANPMKVIRTLNEQSGSHLPFTDDQVQEMKRVCLEELQDVQLWVFVNFLYYTYMRPHEEARLLKVSDIGKRTIRISPQTGKTNVVRHVNIPPGLEDVIEQSGLRNYPPHHYVFSGDGRPGEFFVSESYFYRKHVALLEALDMYGFGYTLYGWKHTGVCAYYRATKDIIAIKEQCGHSSIEQTYQYLRDLGLLAEQADMTLFPVI